MTQKPTLSNIQEAMLRAIERTKVVDEAARRERLALLGEATDITTEVTVVEPVQERE